MNLIFTENSKIHYSNFFESETKNHTSLYSSILNFTLMHLLHLLRLPQSAHKSFLRICKNEIQPIETHTRTHPRPLAYTLVHHFFRSHLGIYVGAAVYEI